MNNIFQKNLLALNQKNPELGKKIQAHIPTEIPQLVQENGAYNIFYKNKFIHNQQNPLAEANEVFAKLSKHFMVTYDEAGSIGKRYRREDEIGTPFCITYDFESENDNCVTVRDRDTMEQVTIKLDELIDYIEKRVKL